MINKELVELQKNCKATCAIIQNEDIEELNSKFLINSNCEDNELLKVFQEDIFRADEMFAYFIIKDIDKLELEKQERFYQIVKDREFCSYTLPEDVVIVFTVENREGLKNILQELYHFCVVAF